MEWIHSILYFVAIKGIFGLLFLFCCCIFIRFLNSSLKKWNNEQIFSVFLDDWHTCHCRSKSCFYDSVCGQANKMWWTKNGQSFEIEKKSGNQNPIVDFYIFVSASESKWTSVEATLVILMIIKTISISFFFTAIFFYLFFSGKILYIGFIGVKI